MTGVLINDILDELKKENNKLLSDLCFERNLNAILDEFRDYSIDLMNNCKCDQNSETFEKIIESQNKYKQLMDRQENSETSVEMIESNAGKDSEESNTNQNSIANEVYKKIHLKKVIKLDINEEIVGRNSGKPLVNKKFAKSFVKIKAQKSKSKQNKGLDLRFRETNDKNVLIYETTEEKKPVKTRRKRKSNLVMKEMSSTLSGDPIVSEIIAKQRKVLPKTNENVLNTNFISIPNPNYISMANTTQLVNQNPQQINTNPKFVYLIPNIGFQCDKCQDLFETQDLLSGHKAEKHPQQYQCLECEQFYDTEEVLVLHKYYDHKKRFMFCIKCDYLSQNKDSLAKHRFAHEMSQFECNHPDCALYFETYAQLIEHRNSSHQTYECSKCDQGFQSEIGLKCHENFIHNEFKQSLSKNFSALSTY